MRKKHPPYCPPTQHEFTAHQETQTTGYWYTVQSRTLLFCTKCGLYFYVDKSPADYAFSGITWNGTNPTIAQTTATLSPEAMKGYTMVSSEWRYDPNPAGPEPNITYGGDNRCQ